MANICKEAEAAIWHNQIFADLCSKVLPPIDATHAVAIASVEASVKCLASAIIVITTSGRSAHLVSKYRPRCPIITVTRFEQVARQAHLYRGILPLHYSGNFDQRLNPGGRRNVRLIFRYRGSAKRLAEGRRCPRSVRPKLRQGSWFHSDR